MRLFIMLSSDTLFKPVLLYNLAIRYNKEIIGVAEVKSKSSFYKNMQFWGLKGSAQLASLMLFKRIAKYSPIPRQYKIFNSIMDCARFLSINYIYVNDVNEHSFVEKIKKASIDIILSFQHQIFESTLLKTPKIACLNCHPSELPKYRGIKPLFWAINNDETRIGITVHSMTKKIDEGRIISQRNFPILKNTSLFENYHMIYSLCIDVISQAFENVRINPDLLSYPIIPINYPYYKNPTVDDLKIFKNTGNKIT